MREAGQLLVGPEKVPRPEKGLKGGISRKLGSRRWRHLGKVIKIKSKCKMFFSRGWNVGWLDGQQRKGRKDALANQLS